MLEEKNVYPLDLFAIGSIKRALSQIDGFLTLIAESNYVAAAPLIRLQLDIGLRFSAFWLVRNPHELAKEILNRKEIRNFKDSKNQRLTDSYLIQI